MTSPEPGALEFPEMFERYREPIRRYLRGLVRNEAEAEDLMQETFLRAYRRLDTLEDRERLSGWLYRIATNISYDRFRQSSFRRRTESLDEPTPAPESTASSALADSDSPRLDRLIDQQGMSTCVQGYIERLSDGYRAVILLHDLEGLTNPEIARMLGCSVATVKIRLHRARRQLQALLEKGCDFTRDQRDVFICEPKPGSDPDTL